MLLARENNRILEELLRTLKPNLPVGEPEGSDDYTEVTFNKQKCICGHYTAPVTPPPLAYTPSPHVLATMEPLDTFLMGDAVISIISAREIYEFIKSSVDDLVLIPRESELTLDSINLECSMPIDPPLPFLVLHHSPLLEKNSTTSSSKGIVVDQTVVPTYHQDKYEDAHAIQDDNPAITKLIHVEYSRDDIAKTETPMVIEEDAKIMVFTLTKVHELPMENKSIEPKEHPRFEPFVSSVVLNVVAVVVIGAAVVMIVAVIVDAVVVESLVGLAKVRHYRSIETSDLILEELTTEIGLDDSIPTEIDESSSSTTSSSEIAALAQQMIKMRKDMLQMYRSNQQVNSLTPSCETCDGPHSYYECHAAGGYTQDVYATSGTYNAGGNSYQPQVIEIQKSLQERPQDALPSNTIPNLERKSKKLPHVVIPPSLVSTSSEIPKQNPHQPPITYPLRLNKEKLQEKSDIKVHKFFQMFKKLYFNISLAEALTLMPKYHKMLKDLLSDKEKLLGLENTSLTKNFLVVLLKKLLEKLRVPRKFLISCDFPELEKCMALAELGASINLMPLSVWKKLMLPELVPTRMTLELANRSIAYPADIAKDVFVQVGKFTFSADFVVVNYDVDPRVPLILGRPFLRTARALVDVYGEELILRDGDEKLILHADSTSKCPLKHGNGGRGNQFNPIKDIDDPVLIPRVSETPLDSFDSCLDSFDTAFTNPLFELDSEYTLNYDNPIFDVQNEDSDASKKETIIDEVQIDSTTQNSPMFKALIPDMIMHDIILYRIRHGIVYSSRLSFYLGLLFPEGVFESHSLDSFELGDENAVFDPGTVVIKGWIKHYYRGDIPIMDVLDLHFSPKDK
nr:reverse transcriptase domain-containing protein [Tanacetum cinerariifolium]